MIDYHCHILPGLDDGAAGVDESLAMARGLAGAGFTSVCCTPHCIRGSYNHSPQQVREATLMLQADLDNAGIELLLGPGMEYCLDEYFFDLAADLLPLGNSRLLLCEAPPQANPRLVRDALQLIIDKGFIPLIAHPERTRYFYDILTVRDGEGEQTRDSGRGMQNAGSRAGRSFLKARRLMNRLFGSRTEASSKFDRQHTPEEHVLPGGCLFQANLGSFVNFYPDGTQQRAYELLKAGLIHCLASDLHSSYMGGKVLGAGAEKLETNPLLKELSRRTPAELEQIAQQAAQETAGGEQQEMDF